MRVVAVVPARWGSTRFPGKSLAPILGRPLIVRVAEAVLRVPGLDRVCVATDDGRIAEAVAGLDVSVVITSARHATGTDRVAEAAAAEDDDVILNIQGDEPFVRQETIEGLVSIMKGDAGPEMATVACPLLDPADLANPAVVKVVLDNGGRALYFSRAPIPFRRDGEPDPAQDGYLRHVGIYAYRGEFLKRFVAQPRCGIEALESLEQLRALHMGARIQVFRSGHDNGVGVDTPEDIARAEEFLRRGGDVATGEQ